MSAEHSHRPSQTGRAFALAMAIQTGFIVVEVIVGLRARSLAVIADAGHNVSDALALALAWAGMRLAQRAPRRGRTYGWKSATIFAAIVNAGTLLAVNAWVAYEAIQRLRSPSPVAAIPVIAVSLAGVLVNGFCAWLVGRSSDLNVRAAFLHLASDAAVAGAVAVTGVAIRLTGLTILDPIASLLVAAVVVWSTLPLLRTAMALAMQAVPNAIDEEKVRQAMLAAPGVIAVHDMHVWALSTSETALTAHLVTTSGREVASQPAPHELIRMIDIELRESFPITHVTLQLDSNAPCKSRLDHP